jgi:autoinducer 2-degrading protein
MTGLPKPALEDQVPKIAVMARVHVKQGRAAEYIAAFGPLLEQADKEPGTLLYTVQRSSSDPDLFWTSEIYADEAAFAVHGNSEVHAAASPIFTELIDDADVVVGEYVTGTGITG